MLLVVTGCSLSTEKKSENSNERYMEMFNLEKINYDIYKITFDEFDLYESDKANKLVLVSREDCQQCHDLMYYFNNVANSYEGNVSLYILESNEMNEEQKNKMMNDYSITGVPILVVIKEGKVTGIDIGSPSDDRLNVIIKEATE